MKTSAVANTLPSWDLSDLYESYADPKIFSDLKDSLKEAKDFRAKYQNKLGSLTPQELKDSLLRLEKLFDKAGKPMCFASLLHASDSSKTEHGSLVSKLQELFTEISEEVTFYSLEWNLLSEADQKRFLSDETLSHYHHYLAEVSKFRPYQLSEKEEVILQKTSLTGEAAWTRLFDEIISRMRFKLTVKEDGSPLEKDLSEEEVLSLLYSPDRDNRKAAAQALTEGLKEQSHLLTSIFNVLVQEHASEDKLRGYPNFMRSRNMSNEIEDEAVQALMKATEDHVGIVERFYKLKKQLLGLPEMQDFDRYAPVVFKDQDNKQWSWQDAQELVTRAYASFDEEIAKIVQEFFDKNWIDADLRKGKRGGAFSASGVPSSHPHILMNFTGTSRDLSTLAHELGHGVHQYLSRKVGYLQADTPLTTAETASVFGEMLTFDSLVKQATSPQEKLGLLITKLDEIIATVFRQVYMTRFEEKLHEQRRSKGELSTEDINKLWLESNQKMFNGSVTLTDNYQYWWSYIGHFVHSPFYCYAYAFGLLLSLTLYSESKKQGKPFAAKYKKVLSLGGSINPAALMKIADVDLNEKTFWANGFALVEELLLEAESLSKQIGLTK
jgi:oligoendopeptidase F